MIATPFYQGSAFSLYITSLLATIKLLSEEEIEWDYFSFVNDAYVERAKNAIVAYFLASDCTDLFLIDSDLSWDPYGFIRVLKHEELFVAGAYPMKNLRKDMWALAIYTNEDRTPKVNEHGLISAEWVSGGFLRFKRPCLERLQNAYSQNWNMYRDPFSAVDAPTACLFQVKVDNNQFVGEDVEFCRKWRQIGGQIWIDPDITFKHQGCGTWDGNYHEFLIGQKQFLKPLEERIAAGLKRMEAHDGTPADSICIKAA